MYSLTTDEAQKALDTFRGEGETTREFIKFEHYSALIVSKGTALCSFNIDPTMQCQINADDVMLKDGELIFKGKECEFRIRVVE